MNWDHIKATIKGAWKSLTVWVALCIGALPDAVPLVQANFATIAPYIPPVLHSRALNLLALVMLLLRIKTTTSLAGKVK